MKHNRNYIKSLQKYVAEAVRYIYYIIYYIYINMESPFLILLF